MAARDTRGVRRDSLVANREAPPIEVDPSDGAVRLEGRALRCEPVDEVPLNRRYLLS